MNLQLRHILASAVVLGLFGMAGTGIVAVTEAMTAPRIEQNEIESRLRLLGEVVPTEICNNDLVNSIQPLPESSITEGRTADIYYCRNDGKLEAVAMEITANGGYSGAIKMLVGVLRDGSVHGARVLAHLETPGLGDKIELRKSDWILSFNGHALGSTPLSDWLVKKDGGVFDQFTGATVTPRAVVQGVKESLIYFNEQRENLIESDG